MSFRFFLARSNEKFGIPVSKQICVDGNVAETAPVESGAANSPGAPLRG